MIKLIFAKYVTYGYLFILFSVSTLPINGNDSTINNSYLASTIRFDYVVHSIMLIPWMLLLLFYKDFGVKKVIAWIISGFLLAIITELIQCFLPYRTFNLIDLIANIIGVYLGFVLWLVIVAFLNKRNNFI